MCRLGRAWRKKNRGRRGVGRRERMTRGRGFKGQDERSRGMETLIAEVLAKIKRQTLTISQAGSAKKWKLIRCLRQFIGHGRCLTMSVQEKQADEVSIQTARSVKTIGSGRSKKYFFFKFYFPSLRNQQDLPFSCGCCMVTSDRTASQGVIDC